MKILAIDVGSGTQDALYYIDDRELENCPKFILPSPSVFVFNKIKKLTNRGKNIYLYGHNMGGGFKSALISHKNAGYKVACSEQAAYAISDNLKKVEQMGIEITETCPKGYVPVYLTDYDPGFWENLLNTVGLDYPDIVMIAAQDHGFFPNISNRKGRFKLWERFLLEKGDIYNLIYEVPDESLTRLMTIQKIIGGGYVADTGGAAILGALYDEDVYEKSRTCGVCIINIGNSHTIGFLLYKDQVYGIYEHHTGILTPEKLWKQINRFKKGDLRNEEVFEDMGHGCICRQGVESIDFSETYVIGPRRNLLQGYAAKFIAPGGDMMLTGAIGLINGFFLITQKD